MMKLYSLMYFQHEQEPLGLIVPTAKVFVASIFPRGMYEFRISFALISLMWTPFVWQVAGVTGLSLTPGCLSVESAILRGQTCSGDIYLGYICLSNNGTFEGALDRMS